jgi:FkbM family methyltransferase
MKRKIKNFIKSILGNLPVMAEALRNLRDNFRGYNKPQYTPLGFKLSGNKIMQTGSFEPAETKIVQKVLPEVETFINIGANIGYYCCIALSFNKYVIAFEPVQRNIRYLLMNIRTNNWDSNIEVFPVALSNKSGVMEIFGTNTWASIEKGWAGISEPPVSLVPASTLDIVLGPRLNGKKCFILVDIEGAEKLMLEGAAGIINMDPKPVWMVEILSTENQPKRRRINPNLLSTFEIFWNAGYEAWSADDQLRNISYCEINKVQQTGKSTLNSINYLFIEKGKKDKVLNFN